MMQVDFYPAGNDVLLILTGRGGSTKGYENKYVRIAENINRKYNFSVFVAAVPENCWDNPMRVFSEAIDCVLTKISPEKFYVMGSSAGANFAIWFSYLFPTIGKVLAVNPVLNLNMHLTDDGVNNFNGEMMYIISGENDPSTPWQEVLPAKCNVRAEIIAGADHFFTDKSEEFIALPEILFG